LISSESLEDGMKYPSAFTNFHPVQWLKDREHRVIIGCILLALSVASQIILQHALR